MLNLGELSAPEWIDLGVAVGTGLLAIATFALAGIAYRQSGDSRRLAAASEEQARLMQRTLAAVGRPVFHVALKRDGRREWLGREAEARIDRDGGTFEAEVVNRGSVAGTIADAWMVLRFLGSEPFMADVEGDPLVETGGSVLVRTALSDQLLDRLEQTRDGGPGFSLIIMYTWPGQPTPARYSADFRMNPADKDACWLIDNEEDG